MIEIYTSSSDGSAERLSGVVYDGCERAAIAVALAILPKRRAETVDDMRARARVARSVRQGNGLVGLETHTAVCNIVCRAALFFMQGELSAQSQASTFVRTTMANGDIYGSVDALWPVFGGILGHEDRSENAGPPIILSDEE